MQLLIGTLSQQPIRKDGRWHITVYDTLDFREVVCVSNDIFEHMQPNATFNVGEELFIYGNAEGNIFRFEKVTNKGIPPKDDSTVFYRKPSQNKSNN